MNVTDLISRRRGQFIAVLVTLGLVLIAVLGISLREESMTPQQARTHIAEIVDETFAEAAPGYVPVPSSIDGGMGPCYDRFGGEVDSNDLIYSREITDIDPAMGDEMVGRAEQVWLRFGVEFRREEVNPRVTRLAGRANGFHYSFTVNRNDQRVHMAAQTPCISKSEWEEAGIG